MDKRQNPVYTSPAPPQATTCPLFPWKGSAWFSQAAPGQRPAPVKNRLRTEIPRTHSSAQKETEQVRSQCAGVVFGRSASHEPNKPTGGEQAGVFWNSVDIAIESPRAGREWHPWLPEGAFGELTGTLITVHKNHLG